MLLVMMLNCDDHVKMQLVLSWVAPLTPPPHLPWSVYTYGPDGFARECPLGRNTNVIGYRFLPSTQVMSSLYSYPPSLSFFLSLILLFCIPRVCLNNIFFSNLAYRGRARRACLACWERQVGGD